MTQEERRLYLIRSLLSEDERYQELRIPDNEDEQFQLYRSLVNVRMPSAIGEEYLSVEDAFLKEEIEKAGVTRVEDITPVKDGLYLWQGDITTLAADAIVNAANSRMLGCFSPCHACIDNCIHTFAGVRLRLKCAEIMHAQGSEEPTGTAKITPAYNLPSRYVIHTVGPIVHGRLTPRHEALLASSYRACLATAEAYHLKSLAFCCISTGVFSFPNQRAAEIAVQTVEEYRRTTGSTLQVIFNVFSERDRAIYEALLAC